MATDPPAPTLLYVEDEYLIQELIVTDLKEAGFEVLVADSAEQAMTLLEANAAIVSALITDVNLGDGLDGWQLARKVRQGKASLPIIYVSALSDHEWASEGVPGSVNGKPFVGAQLVIAISNLLVTSAPPS